MLIRWAWDWPVYDVNKALVNQSFDNFFRNRAICRRRVHVNFGYGHCYRSHWALFWYDLLYDYIKGNEELAQSLSRFVPWIRSSDDVMKLLDMHLLQHTAKKVMRYHHFGDGREPWYIAEIAMAAGDTDFTRPWLEWAFSRNFFYPQALGGIQDYMITGLDRDGRSPMASYGYMIGEFSADRGAENIAKYIENGGDPRFDLRDRKVYPKTMAALDFYFASRTAGIHFPRIGDVCGPDKNPGAAMDTLYDRAGLGWRWTREPKFAYVLRHYLGRKGQSDDEWAAIEAAAATVKRAPWFDNRSRILPGWAAFLETGLEHDDLRFRRSVFLRIGHGAGHGHYDGLDLQVHAHGLPMTVDAGQRGGYGEPGDKNTSVHNTVEIDGTRWLGHSWAQALCDAEHARYLRCQGAHAIAKNLFRRQVALIDVDDGKGAVPLGPGQMGMDIRDLPKDVVTPNSYIFDVFRVKGGNRHRYCFHMHVNDPDGPQPKTNLDNIKLVTADSDDPGSQFIREIGFTDKGERYSGTAPATLQITFALQKERIKPEDEKQQHGVERQYARGWFNPDSPDKYLRWRVFGQDGAMVLKGDQHSHQRKYQIPMFLLQKDGKKLQSVFVALLEPFVGEPFIEHARKLACAGNEQDALRAVALEVQTRNGHTDFLFADGRPYLERRVGSFTVSAEYAFHSVDEHGLRQAVLTGGTQLVSPQVRLAAETSAYTGQVRRVDYAARKVWLDAAWPAHDRNSIIEIGDVAGGGHGGYVTGYTVTRATPQDGGTELLFQRSADYYRALVAAVREDAGMVVKGNLKVPGAILELYGINRNFTASNDQLTKFWRANIEGDGTVFRLHGPTVDRKDFDPSQAVRLWEYGVGDFARRSTQVSLRRVASDVYELDADVQVTVGLQGKAVEISTDQKMWSPLTTGAQDGFATFSLEADRFATGPLFVRSR